jgi:hypothetical protein
VNTPHKGDDDDDDDGGGGDDNNNTKQANTFCGQNTEFAVLKQMVHIVTTAL